jgi:hypothetical protein
VVLRVEAVERKARRERMGRGLRRCIMVGWVGEVAKGSCEKRGCWVNERIVWIEVGDGDTSRVTIAVLFLLTEDQCRFTNLFRMNS